MIRLVLIFFLSLSPDLLSAQNQESERMDAREASKRLDGLIESLSAEDVGERSQAVTTLLSMGDFALPAIPALIRALDDDSICTQAAEALGTFGPAAKDALPKLAARLADEEFRRAIPVAMAIALIGGPDNKSVVRRLIILRHPKLDSPLIQFGYLEKFPQASLKNLIELLNDENDMVREKAATVIGDMVRGSPNEETLLAKTVVTRDDLGPPLISILNDKSISVRIAAATSLASLDQKHSRLLIPTVVDALGQDKIRVYHAVELIRPAANEAIPLLIAALDRKDDWIRYKIASTIAGMPKESLPHLAKASSHNSPQIRASVAATLGYHPFRNLNQEAAFALLPFLRDEDAEVRLRGAESIVRLGVVNADATVPVLIEFLQDKQSTLRARAVEVLMAIGPAARASVPDLLRTLGDDQQSIRILSAIALVSIDKSQGPATLPTLDAAIDRLDENAGFELERLQPQAMHAVGELGPAAHQLVDEIVEIIGRPTDNNRHLLFSSAEALIKISNSKAHIGVARLTEFAVSNKGSKDAIEALVRHAQHAKPSVEALLEFAKGDVGPYREEAAVAVIKIDPDNAEGWEFLHQSFERKDSLNIDRVLSALIKFDVNAQNLLADLERFIGSTHNSSSLVHAITLIGNVGASAKPVSLTLAKLLNDERETVQQAARTALMKIQSDTRRSTGVAKPGGFGIENRSPRLGYRGCYPTDRD